MREKNEQKKNAFRVFDKNDKRINIEWIQRKSLIVRIQNSKSIHFCSFCSGIEGGSFLKETRKVLKFVRFFGVGADSFRVYLRGFFGSATHYSYTLGGCKSPSRAALTVIARDLDSEDAGGSSIECD
jgi:hypothetical protein